MPLRAICNLGNLHAFEYDAEQWAHLKVAYRSIGLRMPCCNSVAIPKISPKGTYFFAHARKGECASAPESDEHLWCKQLIAIAAANAGWEVTSELQGQTPNGEKWIADVFCRRGVTKIAFEVQMSPQSDEELKQRQARYKASGVRTAWFISSRVRPHGIANDKGLPAFMLSPVEIGRPVLVLDFNVSLSEFIVGMLAKRLAWVVLEKNKPTHVEVVEDTCWSCKKPVKQVFGHFTNLKEADDPYEGDWSTRAFTVAQLCLALEKVRGVVTNAELLAADVNPIVKRNYSRGKSTKWPYCNACIHCGAPQDNYFVGSKLQKHYYGEDRAGVLLVKFDRKVKGLGRWVFHSQDVDERSRSSASDRSHS